MTTIEWADETWNPTVGCDRVSPGCDHCYAITTARIRAGNPHPRIAAAFAGTTDRIADRIDWTGKINLVEDRITQPLGWRKPRKVFVNSVSDLFHKTIPDEYIARVFATMAAAPQHTFQILTKRHGRMRSLLRSDDFRLLVKEHYAGLHLDGLISGQPLVINVWPLPNVWLGVSVENQRWADIRIPALLQTPAAVRFLSCEPLLGPVKIPFFEEVDGCTCAGGAPWPHEPHCGLEPGPAWGEIQWVIAGGESGPGARPMHPDWARSLRDQCNAAGAAYLFKQWGSWGPAPFIVRVCDPKTGWQGTDEDLAAAKADSEARGATHVHTGNWHEEDGERQYENYRMDHKPWSLERKGLPDGMEPIRRWGKTAAGRELDGRTWDEFPTAATA